jgi:hypothetical protein
LRQAYDYWQDQPGSYFHSSKALCYRRAQSCRQPILTLERIKSFLRLRSSLTSSFRLCFLWASDEAIAKHPTKALQAAKFLDLTGFKHTSPCSWINKTEIVAFGEDYQTTKHQLYNYARSRRFPKWLSKGQVWPSGKQPAILCSSCKHKQC